MYKIKVHSGLSKRVRRTKSGGFKAAHVGRRKMLIKKTSKRKRGLREKLFISKCNRKGMLYRLSVL